MAASRAITYQPTVRWSHEFFVLQWFHHQLPDFPGGLLKGGMATALLGSATAAVMDCNSTLYKTEDVKICSCILTALDVFYVPFPNMRISPQVAQNRCLTCTRLSTQVDSTYAMIALHSGSQTVLDIQRNLHQHLLLLCNREPTNQCWHRHVGDIYKVWRHSH